MKNSKIEWTEATWNPLRGCTRVSEGCRFCYAERVAERWSGPNQPYEGLVKSSLSGGHPRWTGEIMLVEHMLNEPRKWKRGQAHLRQFDVGSIPRKSAVWVHRACIRCDA